MLVEYRGKPRYVAGRLRFDAPPEPGTIIGPNSLREWLVVLDTDADGVTFIGYAATEDLNAPAFDLPEWCVPHAPPTPPAPTRPEAHRSAGRRKGRRRR